MVASEFVPIWPRKLTVAEGCGKRVGFDGNGGRRPLLCAPADCRWGDMMRDVAAMIWLGVALAATGCTTDHGAGANVSGDAGQQQAACVPSKTVWESTTRAMITDHCSACHGAKPDFGAPFSLLDYDDLVAGKPGSRKVDRIASSLAKKSMPPTGYAPPPHAAQDTLTEWASCGAVHPDHSIGLQFDRPVFTAPKQLPTGTETFDLLAPKFAVGPDVLDLYMCFTFEAPVAADRFVRRIAPVVDDSRVLHHIVLLRDPKKKTAVGQSTCKGMPSDSQYLYAWAPGAGAVEFPTGGLRVTPGERYIVQIHYNNGAGVSDAVDNSGVRIHHGPPTGTEYGMFAPGPVAFAVPPGQTQVATGTCKIKDKMTFIAGMPHMHETGTHFDSTIVRANGTTEPLIAIKGWSFEMQPFYSYGVTLEPGDKLITRCTFANKTGKTVSFGAGTADEMCFNFIFATPPPKTAYCDDFEVDPSADVTYTPGKCAGEAPIAAPAKAKLPLSFDAAPVAIGGELKAGQYVLAGATLHLPAVFKAYVDADSSFVAARGQLSIAADGKLRFDTAARVLVKLKGGQGTDNTQLQSVSGTVKAGAKAGGATLLPDCGATADIEFRYRVDADAITILIDQEIQAFSVPAAYRFTLVK